MMVEFHEHGRLVKGINPSFIVLIPKKEEANKMKDFRPISLIGGLYKIIAKVLAERMGCVMDLVISKNQKCLCRKETNIKKKKKAGKNLFQD